MSRLLKLTAAIAMAVALLGSGAVNAAQSEAWVKVEFKFKIGGKTRTVFGDVPVPRAADVPQYCERDLFWGQNGLVFMWQHSSAEFENAKFISMKCATKNGAIISNKKPTDLLPSPRPMADLAGVSLVFADAKGKEVSKVYQERRASISSVDCKKQLAALTARYKQAASQDKRLGKLTFLRSECVVLRTFDYQQAN